MSSPSRRRSDRVSLTVLLEASGIDSQGQEFSEPAKSLLISRGGAVIILGRELNPEQQIHLRRKAPSEAHRESRVRIVNQTGQQRDGFLYSVEILDSQMDLWGVDFPSITENTEAVAKMLLECTHCRTREVAHLNELELRAFETNRVGSCHRVKSAASRAFGRRYRTKMKRRLPPGPRAVAVQRRPGRFPERW